MITLPQEPWKPTPAPQPPVERQAVGYMGTPTTKPRTATPRASPSPCRLDAMSEDALRKAMLKKLGHVPPLWARLPPVPKSSANAGTTRPVQRRRKHVLGFFAENPGALTSEVSDALCVRMETISNDVSALVGQGRLKRIANARYEVV